MNNTPSTLYDLLLSCHFFFFFQRLPSLRKNLTVFRSNNNSDPAEKNDHVKIITPSSYQSCVRIVANTTFLLEIYHHFIHE